MEIIAAIILGLFAYEIKNKNSVEPPKVNYTENNMVLCSKACESGELAHYRKGSLDCQCKGR